MMKMVSEIRWSTTSDLDSLLAGSRALVETVLNQLLPEPTIPPTKVHEAIRWSVFAGGKRFRPALLIATGQTFGASLTSLLNTAAAFEMIHTYSLIHDDLPSMDDDDLRRGLATAHVQFGEATAILAGDALQSLAFQTISQEQSLDSVTRVNLISELATAAGTPHGMVAGQAEDIEAEAREITAAELEEIHRLKTGALIVAAARCGAIIAQATSAEIDAVTSYARQIGLLFQITDDLLDVSATAEALGKTPGKDARSLKATYPAVYGFEVAQEAAQRVHREAHAALEKINRPTETLRRIADFILHRST